MILSKVPLLNILKQKNAQASLAFFFIDIFIRGESRITS
jgi:hypothetical protein